MTPSEPRPDDPLLRRVLLGLSLTLLGALCLLVLRPLFAPVLWAVVLAYVTWPLYLWMRRRMRGLDTLAALSMTVLITGAVVLPLLWVLVLLQQELVAAYRTLADFLSRGPHALPSAVRSVPWLGDALQQLLDRYATDPGALGREAGGFLREWALELAGIIGNIGRSLFRSLLALLTLFFLYRDGDTLVRDTRLVVTRFLGDRLTPYVRTAGMMTRAVLYGLVVTAFTQGLMAGIGYWIVGVDAPVLLGVLTGVSSAVPAIGTALVWVPMSIWLLVSGPAWKGLVLLLWGVLLVNPVDNVLRPLLISNVTRVPFLLVMFGAIGGLTQFGLMGLLAGPVLLGVGMALWREWATQQTPATAPRADSRPGAQEAALTPPAAPSPRPSDRSADAAPPVRCSPDLK